ncbi:condensation domain-containing protein [Nocardia brasiliensis]
MASSKKVGLTAELERRMRERLIERGLTSAAAYIQARPPGTVIPLSSTQRRMWFAQALFPDDASHNMVVGLRIDGPLALHSLRAGLIGLFDRHSVLRARYRRGLVDADERGGPAILGAGSPPDQRTEKGEPPGVRGCGGVRYGRPDPGSVFGAVFENSARQGRTRNSVTY